MNSEDLDSDPSSSTWMNETFLSWFINVGKIHLRMSRGGSFLLDVNPKFYEVEEHISTTVEVNTWVISTLKNSKSI